jgi:hypothetical protein
LSTVLPRLCHRATTIGSPPLNQDQQESSPPMVLCITASLVDADFILIGSVHHCPSSSCPLLVDAAESTPIGSSLQLPLPGVGYGRCFDRKGSA